MSNLKGLVIVPRKSGSKDLVTQFKISSSEKNLGIESLVECIDSGKVVTVNDNRNDRSGLISFKKENGVYLKTGGGHGFSYDSEVITIEDVIWLIKVTAEYNSGENNDYGNIKNT